MASKVGVDKTVGQLLVAAMGDAQASTLHDVRGGVVEVFNKQTLFIEGLRVPVRHFQAEGFAQQGLAIAQLV